MIYLLSRGSRRSRTAFACLWVPTVLQGTALLPALPAAARFVRAVSAPAHTGSAGPPGVCSRSRVRTLLLRVAAAAAEQARWRRAGLLPRGLPGSRCVSLALLPTADKPPACVQMVNVPKQKNTFCRKCKKHTKQKVSQYKTGKASIFAQGKQPYRDAGGRSRARVGSRASVAGVGGVVQWWAAGRGGWAAVALTGGTGGCSCDDSGGNSWQPAARVPGVCCMRCGRSLVVWLFFSRRQAAVRPEAVRFRWPDQAGLPQEGEDHEEDLPAYGVHQVQAEVAARHQALQALRAWRDQEGAGPLRLGTLRAEPAFCCERCWRGEGDVRRLSLGTGCSVRT